MISVKLCERGDGCWDGEEDWSPYQTAPLFSNSVVHECAKRVRSLNALVFLVNTELKGIRPQLMNISAHSPLDGFK